MDDFSQHVILLKALKQERKVLSAQIGTDRHAGKPTDELIKQSQDLSRRIKELESQLATPAPTDQYDCTEATTADEVLALQSDWQALHDASAAANLYNTWEWMSAWYEAYGFSGRIRCLQVRQGGKLVGLAPLFSPLQRDYQLGPGQLGYAGCYGPAWSFYPEFLLAPGQEEPVMRVLLEALCEERNWWNLKFLRMQTDSPTLALLMAQTIPYGLRLYAKPGLASSVTDLPADTQDVLDVVANSNHRHHCRLAQRRLAEDLPKARFRRVEDPDEIARRLDDLASLNIMRHNVKGIRSNFLKPAFRLHFDLSSRRLMESGRLRLHIIELDGKTLAASSLAQFRDCGTLMNTGFEPRYGLYRPSHLLLLDWVAAAITEGIKSLDMLSYYRYKSEICPDKKHTTDVVVFPDSLRGLLPVAQDVMNRTLRTGVKAALRKARAAAIAARSGLSGPAKPLVSAN